MTSPIVGGADEGKLMVFKQSTILEILESETEMFMRGAERFGDYFVNAAEFNALLANGMIKSIDADRFLFALFLSQLRKHLTLALFSVVRLHHVQAMMNLRQALESGASAAYAIAHTDPADFVDIKVDGTLDPSQRLTKKRYDWLMQNFPAGSAGLKRMKDLINTFGTHSNILSASQHFKADIENGRFETPFFDFEDEVRVKTELWQIANIELGLMDLFYGVNQKLGVVKYQEKWFDQFQALAAANMRLKEEMMAHERFTKFFQ